MKSKTAAAERLVYLDGLRGVAILLVLLFHAYVRWPTLVPYGDAFADVPVFQYGYLGVQLFFLISGFVILMTLERCVTVTQFLWKRWIRLFPAMLICTCLIFLSAPIFPERPAGPPVLRDILPGLTFTDPYLWAKVLGSSQGSLEGAFWSLYVEVPFYIIFGAVYFSFGRAASIVAIAGLFSLSLLFKGFDGGAPARWLSVLGIEYYGWFAAGAMLFLYSSERNAWGLLLGSTTCLISAMCIAGNGPKVAAALVASLFISAIVISSVRSVLTHPAFVFLGFVSYPLYLLHENMMVASIVKVGHLLPSLPPILMPVGPIAFVLALAWVVATHAEQPFRHLLGTSLLQRMPPKTS